MGTLIHIALECDTEVLCDQGFRIVDGVLQDIDDKMSNYHPSELTRIAEAAGSANYLQPVSSQTHAVLQQALEISRYSQGLFDPTITPLLEVYKLYRAEPGSSQSGPTTGAIDQAKKLVDYRELKLAKNAAGLKRRNMQLDLGAIAKGFALDQAAEKLQRSGITAFSLNFGGHLLSRGVEQVSNTYDPRDEKAVILSCTITNGSLSASAQNQRFVRNSTKKIGHLINPKTGMPEEKNLISVVFHDSAMLADAWSTALFFADRVQFSKWTHEHHLIAYQFTATGAIEISETAQKFGPCVRPTE